MTDLTEQPDWLDVSRETLARLRSFADLAIRWNPAINLVSRASLPHLWHRHILDSAQIFFLAPQGARRWADLGSGGGFPGIVMAIIAAEKNPALVVSLIESDRRKATFLQQAIRELSLTATVIPQRIEQAPPQMADVVSARALTALDGLLPLVARHLAPGGVALLPKGAGHTQELREAQKTWSFTLDSHPSLTDPSAVILAVQAITHV